MEVSDLLPRLEVLQPEAASDDAIVRVHKREYIEELKSLSDSHGGVKSGYGKPGSTADQD